MMYLITGAIGTGKTTWVVDKLIQAHEQNEKHIKDGKLDKVRKIFTNIDGLKIPHEPLPDDWRTTPNDSILAIDECHKIDIFKPNRKQLHDDERIIQLNESRHTGHDIYFITQSPKFIHQHVKGCMSQHFHFHNPMGLKASTVFMWRHGNTNNPDSQQAKNIAESETIYQFKKDVQDQFQSIEEDAQHTRKFKLPRKVLLWGSAPFVLIAVIVYLLTKPSTTGNLTGETFVNKTKQDLDKAKQSTETMAHPNAQNNLDIECRKAVNVEKPECVQWFNNLSNNKGSVTGENTQNTLVVYSPEKPFEQDFQKDVRYEVTAKPVFSGCMHSNGKYTAYTQQGTKIEVSQSDCEKLIKDNDRPFNYFKNDQNTNHNINAQASPVAQEKPMTAEQYAKYMQYLDSQANNQVDPRLQQNQFTVNGANSL